MKKKKQKKWVKLRHTVVMFFLRAIMKIAMRIKCGYHYEKYKGPKTPTLFIANHQTSYDQFMVGLMCPPKTYFVMTDDITTIKFVSKIINFLVHPIPYKKASTDFTILRNCKQVISEGGSICIFVEGNRTYSGKTEYVNETIVKMVKFLKIPLVSIKIEGGYGVCPRWANNIRKGSTKGSITKVYQYEDYKDLPDEELYKLIVDSIYVDESSPSGPYKSKKKAEHLERVIYNCPTCGFTKFYSKGDILGCTTCDLKLKYNEYKQFESENGKVPFKNVNEWYDYQKEQLFNMNVTSFDEDHIFFEDVVKFIKIVPRKRKEILAKEAKIKMYSNRLTVEYGDINKILYFDDISSSGVFGKNKANFFTTEDIYQLKGDKSFNSMKYVNLYYKYKIEKGEQKNDKFIGL